jgi:hypothetical protein
MDKVGWDNNLNIFLDLDVYLLSGDLKAVFVRV